MLTHRYTTTASVSGGEWSANTMKMVSSLCYQIFINPTTSTTIYDFYIQDKGDRKIKHITGIQGVYNDLTPLITEGIHTLKIENSDTDEDFTICLHFLESSK